SLSYKNTLPGPWTGISERIQAGDQVTGVVKRLVTFGAFVEIEDGVEGLVHISQIANRHIGTPEEVLSAGEEVTAKVLSIDEEQELISLSIIELDKEQQQGYIYKYEKYEDNSSFQLGVIICNNPDKYKD